jgi:DNA repair exonuclease SbcCD ATPase subunit
LQLKEIRLNDFGKFHNKSIPLQDGINLIYGENEAGKSTLHTFIKGMLFGIEKLRGRASKDDIYEKYKPWDHSGSYYGSLDLVAEGKNLRIIRNFDKNNKNCTILDIDTGRELDLPAEELRTLFGGLTEAGYRNTISIEQLKVKTDQELAEEVRNYITNLSLTKSSEVDVTKALGYLQDKKKALETGQLSGKLSALEKEIEEGFRQEEILDQLTLQLKDIEEQELALKRSQEVLAKEYTAKDFTSLQEFINYLNQFPVIKEKYQNDKEARQQKASYQEKLISVEERLPDYREDRIKQLKNKIKELDTLKYEITNCEEEYKAYLYEENQVLKQGKKSRTAFTLLPVMIGAILLFVSMGKSLMISFTGLIFLLTGAIVLFILNGRLKKRQNRVNLTQIEQEKILKEKKNAIKTILNTFQASDEKALKTKYEEALRLDMTIEHLLKQRKEYSEQIELLNKKTTQLEKEITEYLSPLVLRSTGEAFIGSCFEGNELEEDSLGEIEKHVISQKQSIVRNQELYAKEAGNLRIQKEKLKWELASLEGCEDKLFEHQELYEELLKQKSANDLELEAVKLSIETINSLSLDIHDGFGRELNELVSKLSGEVTNKKYLDIKIDEKLNMKVGHKDNYVLLNKLSAGTIEQLYFALRLAVADLVYKGEIMPILIDDCFALYDDYRTEAALLYLAKERKGQVLLFTCHNREKSILDRLNINYNYIDLSEGS